MRALAVLALLLAAAVPAHAQYTTSDGISDPDTAQGDVMAHQADGSVVDLDDGDEDARYQALSHRYDEDN